MKLLIFFFSLFITSCNSGGNDSPSKSLNNLWGEEIKGLRTSISINGAIFDPKGPFTINYMIKNVSHETVKLPVRQSDFISGNYGILFFKHIGKNNTGFMGYGVMTFPIYDKGALVEEIQPGGVVKLSIRYDDIQVQDPYTLDLKGSDVFSVAFCADKEAVGNDFDGWSYEKCLLSNKLKVKELM